MTHASFRYVPKWRSRNQSPARGSLTPNLISRLLSHGHGAYYSPSSVSADKSGYVRSCRGDTSVFAPASRY
jgi:hypothetical protein